EQLKKCICIILLKATKNKDVSQTIELLVNFACSSEVLKVKEHESSNESSPEVESIFNFVIRVILSYHDASCKHVRLQVCNIISKMLETLLQDIRLDVSLIDDVTQKMRTRLHDSSPLVRMKAISALSRIQDPEDDNCLIMQDYLIALELDLNANVRRSVLSNICFTKKSLKTIFTRLYDVNPIVRKALYDRLQKGPALKSLEIGQREKIISAGIEEKVVDVKSSFQHVLIEIWFKGTCASDLITFIHLFDVEDDRDFLYIALQYLYNNLDINCLELCMNTIGTWIDSNTRILSENYWTIEYVFIWCSALKYILSNSGKCSAYCQDLIPEISKVCACLSRHIDLISPGEDFILIELFSVLRNFELNDESGRKSALDTLLQIISKPSKFSLKAIKENVRSYIYFAINNNKILDVIVEVISEIRQPINMVDPLGLEENLKLSDTEPEPLAEKTDILLACLSIVAEVLQIRNVDLTTSRALALLKDFILPLIQDARPDIRIESVRCLSLFCIGVNQYVQKYLLLLFQIVNIDTLEIKNMAISAIFDIFTIHGVSVIEKDHINFSILNYDKSVEFILNLCKKETHQQTLLILVSGIAKLFLFRRTKSEQLMSFLILSYLKSEGDNDNKLRIVLSQFFQTFRTQKFSDDHDILIDACAISLRTTALVNANSKIDITSVINFITNITEFCSQSLLNGTNTEPCLREKLVLNLFNEMIVEENSDLIKQNLKILSSFTYFVNTQKGLETAERFNFNENGDSGMRRVIRRIEDKLCLRDFTNLLSRTQAPTDTAL
ncbi:hypothetical protein MXB_2982, partial [Myxobolus squamalis]